VSDSLSILGHEEWFVAVKPRTRRPAAPPSCPIQTRGPSSSGKHPIVRGVDKYYCTIPTNSVCHCHRGVRRRFFGRCHQSLGGPPPARIGHRQGLVQRYSKCNAAGRHPYQGRHTATSVTVIGPAAALAGSDFSDFFCHRPTLRRLVGMVQYSHLQAPSARAPVGSPPTTITKPPQVPKLCPRRYPT